MNSFAGACTVPVPRESNYSRSFSIFTILFDSSALNKTANDQMTIASENKRPQRLPDKGIAG
jgi:hypothetical protein